MAQKPKKKELGGRENMSTSTKVIIAIFAVIMAVSMMMPSLAQIFASGSAAEEQAEETPADEQATDESTADEQSDDASGDKAEDAEAESKDDESKDAKDAESKDAEEDDALKGVPDNESLKSLAEQNAPKAKKFEDRLKEDPDNLAALLNLGSLYMNWGYSATYSATTDEETAYAKDLVKKAVDCFDKYLKLNDDNAVKVNKALCEFYAGDAEAAVKALEKITADVPDYPLAWANLGMLYEQSYDTEKASEAYKKAVETDPNDEYGAKTYANQRIIALNSKVSSPGDAGDASADDISTKPESGLTSTLANDSGVGF